MTAGSSSPATPRKRLIVTADDFGLDPAVNEAVEAAHRTGILTATSLMVAAPAAADAVKRAKALPGLGVGLHLALVDALPCLPAAEIAAITDQHGGFDRRQVRAGFRFFFSRAARAALAREIRAQFRAFAATGLPLDHVNAHKHMHLHPTVGRLMIEIGREFGLKAVRIPDEPPLAPGFGARALRWWTGVLRGQVRRAGLIGNDQIFGLAWTGAMTEERVIDAVGRLPAGVSELYSHPAAYPAPALRQAMPDYVQTKEFAALISPKVRQAVIDSGAELCRFRDL